MGTRSLVRVGLKVCVAAAVLAAGVGLTTLPASAAPSVSSVTVSAPDPVTRGVSASTEIQVAVGTTENSTFGLQVSAPDMSVVNVRCSATPSCTTGFDTDGTWLIGDDGDSNHEELVTAQFGVDVRAGSAIALTSTEGETPPSATRTISATVTPRYGTEGGVQVGTGAAQILGRFSDAEVRLVTNSPTGAPTAMSGGGSTVAYSATFSRFAGSSSTTTEVDVRLLSGSPQGTFVDGPNPRRISLTPVEPTASVTFDVKVPYNAPPGEVTYQFEAKYNPTSQATPIDTEEGNPTSFVVAEPASISGVTYRDADRDGSRDAGEPGLWDWVVYIDGNGNNARDPNERATLTGQNGHWRFDRVAPGPYIVRQVVKRRWTCTSPAATPETDACEFELELDSGENATVGGFGLLKRR